MIKRLIFALVLGVAISQASLAEGFVQLGGVVVSVADGDTVTLQDADGKQYHIRLAQIDAPEVAHGKAKLVESSRESHSQPYGDASKRSLSAMVLGERITADCSTRDRYQRFVCQLYIRNLDVNREQVARGMAMVYERYASDKTLLAVQQKARDAKLGLWHEENPVPPWDWRNAR